MISSPTATLAIDRAWNGASTAPEETARIALRWAPGGLALAVDAPFHGDPPPPARPGPCDRLWEHEVVEVFLAGANEPPVAYTEIELSPHGHYLVLRLLGVRNPIDFALPLAFEARIEGRRWRGNAVVPAGYLPPGALRGNAYAVHGVGVRRRHLAAYPLPGERPDFHRPDAFVALDLGPREARAERPGC
jgi:hypothetical protein